MHVYNYKKGLDIGRVNLEMSLKPFVYLDDEFIDGVCRKLFTEWKPLTDKASAVSVMLWTADGSEILEYSGDLDEKFNWCNLIGIGNPRRIPETQLDFENLHIRPVPYSEHMHDFTYRDLKKVISAIKRVGKELTGMDIDVTETFDPGPEFAKSDFKFNRHTELSVGSIMDALWIHCGKKLKAEDRAYAAYPNGIPDATPFGEFLGKQFMALKKDVGFDRIWLSNGFGFSLESWNCKGELFDGNKFDFTGAKEVRESIAEFWRTFSLEIGDTIVETRGSNLSLAMDISAHGCPIDEIYKYNMTAPPNSPWAALDSRYGLELAGYLSRISELPKNGFMFRYYIHDPWWVNSPWFDRYQRMPQDIYLPMSLARLDEKGKVTKPAAFSMLSCDDSFGDMPERCPNEVIPHVLSAYNDYPSSPGLVTWLYPFDSYCKTGLRDGNMDRIFMDDWFIENAIDRGMPLSSVISDKNFDLSDKKLFKNTVLLCPVPEADSLLEKCIFSALNESIPLLLYGNTKHVSEKLRKLIGVNLADEGIDGILDIKEDLVLDIYENNDLSHKLCHSSLVSNGKIYESPETNEYVKAIVTDGTNERAYVCFNEHAKLAWIRGSFPHRPEICGGLPEIIPATEQFPVSALLRYALSFFGIKLYYKTHSAADDVPYTLFADSDESIFVNTFAKQTCLTTYMSTTLGAPICEGDDAYVENDVSETSTAKWKHSKMSVFIKQKDRTHITVTHSTPLDYIRNDGTIIVSGLKNATVTVRLTEPFAHVIGEIDAGWPRMKNAFEMKYSENGLFATAENLTGELTVYVQKKEIREEYTRLGYFDFK